MSGGRTHRPVVKDDACQTCGGCRWSCPASVFPSLANESDSLRGAIFQARPFPGEPASREPCVMACPLGQDVPGYLAAIARGDLESAAETIRRTNALPSVCGRMCIASCMRACVRASIDEGLDIRGLKRFAAEAVRSDGSSAPTIVGSAPQVAVIGGGPAGLAAAHRLFQLGLKAIVYEAGDEAGGLLATAVPSFVLPREKLAHDVFALERLGVEIKLRKRVGVDVAFGHLDATCDAVLVTTGAGCGSWPGIAPEGTVGVVDAVGFARDVRSKRLDRVDGVVVVSGGSPMALQVARSARRLGATAVKLVYPYPLELWPSTSDEQLEARGDGVELIASKRVVGLAVNAEGRLEGCEVKQVAEKRRDAVQRVQLFERGKQELIAADVFISAGSRRPDPSDFPTLEGIEKGLRGVLRVDEQYRLGRNKWYAAGEAATGQASVVDSMATGRQAAESIARDLAEQPGGM